MPRDLLAEEGQGKDLLAGQSPPSTPEEKPGFSASNMVLNAPGSLYKNTIEPLVTLATKPGMTAENFMNLLRGLAKSPAYPETHEIPGQVFNSLIAPYRDPLKTLEEDPFRIPADLSMILGGSGAAAKATGIAAKLPWLYRAGKATGDFGKILEPLNATKEMLGIPMKLIPDSTLNRIYESALKPRKLKEITPGQREASITFARENGVLLNNRGLEKVRQIIEDLDDTFDQTVIAGKKAGETIDAGNVIKYLDDTKSLFGRLPAPSKYLDEISQLETEFLKTHEGATQVATANIPGRGGVTTVQWGPKGGKIPVDEALQMKRAIYAVHKKAYNELSTVTQEANKALAYGIKEELINLYPELRDVGMQERDAIKLERMIADRLGTLSKRDFLNLGDLAATGTGAVLGGPGGAALSGIAMKIAGHPVVKSYLANLLTKYKKGMTTSDYWTGVRQRAHAMATEQYPSIGPNLLYQAEKKPELNELLPE